MSTERMSGHGAASRVQGVLHGTPVRLAIGFTLAILLGVLLANLIALRVVDVELDARRDRYLAERFEGFAATLEEEGIEGLIESVDGAVGRPDGHATIAALLGADGRTLAGERFAAAFVDLADGLSTIDPDALGIGSDHPVRVLGGSLGSYRLFIGSDSDDAAEVAEIMLGAFAWATLAVLVLAIGAAAQVAARVRVRFDAVGDTLRSVADGTLSARVPLSRRSDDIDALGSDINDALDRLESAVGAVRQVSTDIAHDLRTPLGRLRITIEKARAAHGNGEASHDGLTEALAQCDALASTFSALLRIARLESGARRSRFARVDLVELVRDVGSVYEDVAEDAGRSLQSIGIDKTRTVPIRGDAELLTQLLANLVENALNHGPPGTQVECRVEATGERPALVVSDDGPGVPEAERDKVLRRLYRLDSSRTRPGSGLGLSLVKAIADLHGATLSLEDNAPGLRVVVGFDPAGEAG